MGHWSTSNQQLNQTPYLEPVAGHLTMAARLGTTIRVLTRATLVHTCPSQCGRPEKTRRVETAPRVAALARRRHAHPRLSGRIDDALAPYDVHAAGEGELATLVRRELYGSQVEGRDREGTAIEIDLVAALDDGRTLTGRIKWNRGRRAPTSPCRFRCHTRVADRETSSRLRASGDWGAHSPRSGCMTESSRQNASLWLAPSSVPCTNG